MSILDEWFTGLQAAATSVATAVVGAAGAWLALRRRLSTDSADIKRTHLEMGWLERLVKERDEQDERIESLRESQLNDARQIARLEAEAKECRERITEAQADRDHVMEEMREHNARLAASEERSRALSEQLIDLRLANGRLFKELAIVDKDAADRLLVQYLRPPNKDEMT